MLKVSLVLISGNHFVVLGRNSLTPEELKDKPLYKIPIIGLFRSKLFFFLQTLLLQMRSTQNMLVLLELGARATALRAMTLP